MSILLKRQTAEEQRGRKVIMEVAYLSLAAFMFLVLILVGPPSATASPATLVGYAAQALIATASLASFVLSRRGYTMVGAYFLPSGLLLLAYFFIYYSGLGTNNSLFFITTIVIASITLGIRGTVLFAALSSASAIGLYFAQTNGLLATKAELTFPGLAVILAHILGNSFVLVSLMHTFTNNLRRALEANKELRQLQASLEQRVADRTRDLRIASDVSRQITRELKLDALLPQLVERTKAGFDLYHASVFLYDPETEELVLEAGTGKEGAQMQAEAKSFHISAHPSLVAQAARERCQVVRNDVSQFPDHLFNPHLPETRAEAAFPMVVGDELVGVLDLQTTTTGRFKESDEQILSTLAEQIAVAIQNARLYEEQVHVAEQLREVEKMKSQFLTNMSHELRTPLNAIINFTQLVALGMVGEVTEEQRDLLEQSINSSRHLLHLINDVLDISKIQAGKLSLFVEDDVDLNQEIESTLGMVDGMIADKSIRLVKDIDSNLPVLSGDKRRIRQVLLNLLSNAAKFTEQGSITLSAKFQGNRVVIAVIDTGPGIPKTAQELIFEPFTQTEDGVKLEGTGLGLPISRSLARAHGGELWVESEPGEGAAFYFTLPVKGESS